MASSDEFITPTQHRMDTTEQAAPTASPITTKQSWRNIKDAVMTSRKIHAHFANKIPHDFKFLKIRPEIYPDRQHLYPQDLENYTNRVFFLGVLPGHRENQLLYVDLPKNHDPSVIDKAAEWKTVVAMFPSSLQPVYSKEEELLRERKRVGVHGVTSFDISEDKTRVFFPAGGDMYYIDEKNLGRLNSNVPKYLKFDGNKVRTDPKMSPQNPEIVAYVQDSDLWVKHNKSGEERRLTVAHKGLKDILEDPISSGVASYVVQEEFDRYTGYWWQPSNPEGVHRILYEEVDESEVLVLHIANPLTQPDVDSYRYPRAGTKNPKTTLKTVEFRSTPDGKFIEPIIKRLRQPLEDFFPWMEYLVRVNWLSSGKGIWAQLLDRSQQRSAVVYIPTEFFDTVDTGPPIPIAERNQVAASRSDPGPNDVDMAEVEEKSSEKPDPGIRILLEETSKIWINVHDSFYFFKNNASPHEIRFVWSSERTGHRHLYQITSNLHETQKPGNTDSGDVTDSLVCSSSLTALTEGDWDVSDQIDSLKSSSQIWVNDKTGNVFFMGLKDTPLETHLYKVNQDDPSNPIRMTQSGRSHIVYMNEDCDIFVTVSSSIKELYSAQLYQLNQEKPVMRMNLLEALTLPSDYRPPEVFSFKSESAEVEMYGMIHRPINMEPDKKYPTVLYVYGGPRVQLVTNSFKGLRYQRLYTLAALGYTVVSIDGRGSIHRGLKFEGHVKGKLGQVEIADQVEGLKVAAERFGCIDMGRVAVHGWSYGGYLSLMGLAQRPDIFKMGIAGAPVTCWKMYDTGYTERYIGTPESNPDGYHKGSPLKMAHRFPDQPNRLFLVQGLIDENVHFVHIAHFIHALVRCCKPYQLQIYPGERHGIRSPDSNEHFEVVVISYLQQYL